MTKAPSKKQIAALRWLIERGITERIPSGQLGVYYEERARAEHEAGIHREYGFRPTARRVVAWKRSSGRQLSLMKEAGLVEWDGWDRYHPRYRITEAGMAAAREEPPRRPRPDFDPHIDYPERYTDGPI